MKVKRMIKSLVFLALLLPGLSTRPVAAHVLLQDKNARLGAIVHINPDDDPVAGEVTQLYIDIKKTNTSADIPLNQFDVFITSTTGMREQLSTSVAGSVIKAVYVFDTRGLYTLQIVSNPATQGSQEVFMEYSLRVSRGAGTAEAKAAYAWAEIVLFLCGICIILLMILGWNNRKRIFAQSKF